jgi:hypothetical protein
MRLTHELRRAPGVCTGWVASDNGLSTATACMPYTALDARLPVALGAHFADEAPTTLP